jgi:uncharacterized membrane protein YgcG
MKILQKCLALLLSCSLLLAATPGGLAYASQTDQSAAQPAAPIAKQSPEELQQLVAPIALYPDALVSQILAGATYPTEIVEADRWMQERPNLKGKDLANEVDKLPWDPSVKALTQFPSVLANMDKNLSWTSSLGDAYVNQSQDVMDAVQAMRTRAQKSGNLQSNKQVKVETQGQTIVIEPADPEVVYVPAYNPWLVFGAPVAIWPGWYAYPGLYMAGPGISFGLGFGVGFFGGFGWGWHNWGCDWAHRTVIYNHNTYISHSTTIINRNNFSRTANNFNRTNNNFNRTNNNFNHGTNSFNHAQPRPQHGFAGQSGTHSGAFSGYNHGGTAQGYSSRGRSSFGGGFHGGGFHGGGHR